MRSVAAIALPATVNSTVSFSTSHHLGAIKLPGCNKARAPLHPGLRRPKALMISHQYRHAAHLQEQLHSTAAHPHRPHMPSYNRHMLPRGRSQPRLASVQVTAPPLAQDSSQLCWPMQQGHRSCCMHWSAGGIHFEAATAPQPTQQDSGANKTTPNQQLLPTAYSIQKYHKTHAPTRPESQPPAAAAATPQLLQHSNTTSRHATTHAPQTCSAMMHT